MEYDMTLQDLGIFYKKIDKILVDCINFRGKLEDIPSKIDEIRQASENSISEPIIAVIDYGVYSEGGVDIDLCFPPTITITKYDIERKYLEEVEVLAIKHYGSDKKFGESVNKLFEYLRSYGVLGTSWIRLIYHNFDSKNQNENEIEIQAILHQWDYRLAKNIDRVLGEDIRKELMNGRENLFTIESILDKKVQWIKDVLTKLDKIASDNQKYEILSCCAHEFSQKRIDKLKLIYKKTGDIDEILKEMDKDFAWYEGQKRVKDCIFVQKIPYNQEGYAKAKTLEEKKKNYCHCSLVRNHLNEGISPTFCNCSAGWYQQYWEGILGKPIQIQILKSLVRGDDVCEFKIYLPK